MLGWCDGEQGVGQGLLVHPLGMLRARQGSLVACHRAGLAWGALQATIPLPVFLLVTEGESVLFPATFIYHFAQVSMETSHDITG